MLGWGGFSLAAHRTATTPLIRLARGEATLSPAVTMMENSAAGLAPGFQSEGFVKPGAVTHVWVDTTLTNITGFRLEALMDPNLPYGGPGLVAQDDAGDGVA